MFRRVGRVGGIVFALALGVASAAAGQVQPYGTNDFGGFRNVLPPGENGFDNAAQAAAFKAAGTYPPHSGDQLGMYSSLTTSVPITGGQIPQFYKDATFGVPAGNVASTESPEPGATIERDSAFGVPHIYGDTRAALMFGIGYATAEDRLFFVDVLRHAGEADLAQFAGGANVGMDESVWQNEPYTPQDLTNQVSWGRANLPDGQQIFDDAANYTAGINAYIAKAESPLNALTMMPAEYAAIGQPLGPQPFTVTDILKIATLVGGIFGNGGGQQLSNAVLYENLRKQFGPERRSVAGSPELVGSTSHKKKPSKHKNKHKGKPRKKKAADAQEARARKHPAPRRGTRRAGRAGLGAGRVTRAADKSGFATFLSFVDPNDPEAPATVRGKSFPYQTLPKPSKAVRRTLALPDAGTVQYANPVAAGAVPPGESGSATAGSKARPASGLGAALRQGLLAFGRGMSNALLVGAANSASGHPLVVMGPQVSYFSPEILMEQDEHGPGIDARGAAFPGTNLYVQLGHGPDYAWSATSSGQNIIDTFAAPLCSPGGGAVSLDSDYYELNGQCVQMETLTRRESWQPNLGDQTPAGNVTFQTKRTAYGIVIARGRIKGRPVVYTNLRSTYMHELDSAVGFERFNEPAAMRNPQDFMNAAYQIGYTFNWFYADDKHIAYFNSGQNPVRAPHTNPLFPTWAQYAWPGLHPAAAMTPASLTEQQTPQSAHPQTVDQQPFITSWNNKQAPGYNDAATAQQYSSIFRSQLLDQNINAQLAQSGGKMTLAGLINAMGTAGTQDLRGVEVLPYVLKIIGHPSDPALAGAVDALQTWVGSGAHRINRAHPGASGDYEQSDAVRIMDAWWPLLVSADFGSVLGSDLLGQVEADFPIDDAPPTEHAGAHTGSAFDVGFYGIVQKDLRRVLGQKVAGPLNRVYCGGGSLSACRAALEDSLRQAIAKAPQQVYPGDKACNAGDQMCADSIQFRAIGVITQPPIEWVNRPTFQQADEIPGHGPR